MGQTFFLGGGGGMCNLWCPHPGYILKTDNNKSISHGHLTSSYTWTVSLIVPSLFTNLVGEMTKCV